MCVCVFVCVSTRQTASVCARVCACACVTSTEKASLLYLEVTGLRIHGPVGVACSREVHSICALRQGRQEKQNKK